MIRAEKFKEAAEAYDVLSIHKKNLHMISLVMQECKAWAEAQISMNEFLRYGEYLEIFLEIYLGWRSSSRRVPRGQDLQYNLNLSLKDAVLGTKIKLKFRSITVQ
ncbi:MAG: hypothetical protein Ct9H90mP6_00220 [Gammaproteobacteria bacterium]|nr:MAG: hypothetical protein Ct9H90mP6_00220 [Gammaproteobacteria bacterium]